MPINSRNSKESRYINSSMFIDNSNTEKVEFFFDNYAYDFDSIYGSINRRSFFTKLLDNLFRKSMFQRYKLTLQFIFDKQNSINSCLDIGTGPGRYCIDAASRNISSLGVDISETMIKLANNRIPSNLSKKVSFVCDDYLNLNLKKKYDVSILMGFFDYVENPSLIFHKLKKDTSKFILASFPKKYEPLSFQRLLRYKLRNCPLYFYTRKQIINLIENLNIKEYQILNNHREFFAIIEL